MKIQIGILIVLLGVTMADINSKYEDILNGRKTPS